MVLLTIKIEEVNVHVQVMVLLAIQQRGSEICTGRGVPYHPTKRFIYMYGLRTFSSKKKRLLLEYRLW